MILLSMDVDMIENGDKSISSLFIDEIIGCEQWTPCSRAKITSLFLKSDDTIRFSMRTNPPGSILQVYQLIPPKSTPYNLENYLMIIGLCLRIIILMATWATLLTLDVRVINRWAWKIDPRWGVCSHAESSDFKNNEVIFPREHCVHC